MKKTTCKLLSFIILIASLGSQAQVKYGNNATTINPNSLLELESTNKGLLLSRLALAQTTLPAPLSAHVQGMTVYNIATVNDVVPGIYFNDGTKWVSLTASSVTGNYWSLTGNSGTVDGTNFIGTTDNTPLDFRVNGKVSGKLIPAGSVFFGYQSGVNSTTTSSVGMGRQALFSSTSGDFNSAFGNFALYSNTSGASNTAIGSGALQNNNADQNTAVGTSALNSNTTGYQNTAVGLGALQLNTSGYLNTAAGRSAMQFNTTGSFNASYGNESMVGNTTGNNNSALGYAALVGNQDGNNNTAIGFTAMQVDSHGSDNTAVGYETLLSCSACNDNTTIGSSAASNLTQGNNNIVIGYNAQASAATVSGEITIGSPNTNTARLFAGGWTIISDRRLKHDIKNISVGLNFVMALKPVEFVYNSSLEGTKCLGFLAQDVQDNMRQNNMENKYGLVSKMDSKYLGLKTTELIPILTKAIQEQEGMIEQQQTLIAQQKAEIEKMNQRLDMIEKAIKTK